MTYRHTVRALRLAAFVVFAVVGLYAFRHGLVELMVGMGLGFLVTFLFAVAALVEQNGRQAEARRMVDRLRRGEG